MTLQQREEPFDLPVEYLNHEIILPARLVQFGYSWKIYVQIKDQEIVFEPDEERNFRAVGQQNNTIPFEIVQAIAVTLEKYFR